MKQWGEEHMKDSNNRKTRIKDALSTELAGIIRSANNIVKARTGKVLMFEAMVAVLMMVFVMPPYALASTDAFNVENAFQGLNDIVTYLLVPVGIAMASARLVYIAVMCGLIGIDPLNLIGGNLDQDHVWSEVRGSFRNFAYGIAWVAGIWILFEFVMFIVANLANVISENFG